MNFFKRFWFLLTTIVVLLQTAVTFGFLYLKSESDFLSSVIIILAVGYGVSFLVLSLMSLHAGRYSREALGSYKSSQKAVKRLLNLIMLAMNILFIINSKNGFVLAPIIMILFNLFLIFNRLFFYINGGIIHNGNFCYNRQGDLI